MLNDEVVGVFPLGMGNLAQPEVLFQVTPSEELFIFMRSMAHKMVMNIRYSPSRFFFNGKPSAVNVQCHGDKVSLRNELPCSSALRFYSK